MTRTFGLGLLFLLSAVTLMAAKNSQTFYLSTDVQAGKLHLPRGICEVTWSNSTGSQMLLTIKTEGNKTMTVPAHMVEGKQDRTGVVTTVVNGVAYLVEIRTRDAKFTLLNSPGASK